eukprot:TRINITY_DN6578_c0_g1_i1.p1 TRINITY_DN6578_c0_g1~~TRINITY_DN6578_c0_g1_i1.p1  ORF type:complete len:479 (-),score=115.20 TRINITY_DN6578_c0_g1_i1:8-1444(-)
MEGILQKQGEKGLNRKAWKKRYFKLNPEEGLLDYYKHYTANGPTGSPAGTISLSLVTSIEHSPDPRLKFSFEIHTANRVWFLLATNEDDRNNWVNGLNALLPQYTAGVGGGSDSDSNSAATNPLNDKFMPMGLPSSNNNNSPDPFSAFSAGYSPPVQAVATPAPFSSDPFSAFGGAFPSSQPLTPPSLTPVSPARPYSESPPQPRRAMNSSQITASDRVGDPDHKEGWLFKQGRKGLVRTWKKRYFITKRSKLWYYKPSLVSSNVNYEQAAGFISLSSVTHIQLSPLFKTRFEIHSLAGNWMILANSQEEAEEWVNSLERLRKVSQKGNISSRSPLQIGSDDFSEMSTVTPESPAEKALMQRILIVEDIVKKKELEADALNDRCTKMSDKMILYSRISLGNWSEFFDGLMDKEDAAEKKANAEESKEKKKGKEDEAFEKQVLLLRRQIGEKVFIQEILEKEVARLKSCISELDRPPIS